MSDKIVNLYAGDTRCVTLIDQLFEAIKTRGNGVPIPSIIGCLELVKMELLTKEEYHDQ